MARFVTGKTFGTTETVTAALLNQAVNDAAISTDSVDNSTIEVNSNALRLKDSASTSTGVTTAKIANNAVTLAKMATQADQTVLGNVSGGTAVPTAVPIVGAAGILVNNDSLGTDDTKGATQGNIKAYADGGDIGVGQTWQPVTRALDGTSYTNSTGKPIMVKGVFSGSTDDHTVTINVTPSGGSTVAIIFSQGTNSGGGVASNGSIIIPNNTSYNFTKSGDAINSSAFHELR
jgi:hypothetical protein